VGWHKTISNVTVAGITTVTQDVHYDLLDNATDAGLLNDADITTIIRTSAGYRFWGNRTCAGDDQGQFAFESATRTLCVAGRDRRDVLAVLRPADDRGPVKDLLETVNAQFRKYTLKGWVMGAGLLRCRQQHLGRAGRRAPTFRIQFTPCAPLENPQVSLVITDTYYTGFAQSVTG
jgi:phage tail sheath protein FI